MSAFKNSAGKLLTVAAFAAWIAAAIGAIGFSAPAAYADTITPTSFSATLGVGESVTVRKTVVVDTAPSTAVLDVMFLFDTTGSMGSAIANAKTAAAGILTSLGGFGSLASGTGYYNDPLFNGVVSNLTTTAATTITSINTFAAGVPGGGGDLAEFTYAGIVDAATRASWRAGSSRFIIALGDAPNKLPPNAASTIASLAAADVSVIGLEFGPGTFTASITAIGGTAFSGGTSPASIAAAIIAGVSASFAEYARVTVGDLDGGLPLIDVSTTCISAAAGGSCIGSDAVGDYTRAAARSFEFDVTFTRLAAGDAAFDTFALVDGRIVATEADRFGGEGTVPVPGTLLLLGIGFLGFALARRRIG